MSSSESVRSYLRVRSAMRPSFSPDGTRLAYLSDESGVFQVWMADISDADMPPQQVTSHDDKVSIVKFSPQGGHLIYVMDSGGNERHQFTLLLGDGEPARALTQAPEVMHNWGGWSKDGRSIVYTANDRDPALMDAFVMDVASGEARRVFESDGWYTAEGLSPDETRLLLLESIGSSDQELHLVDVASGSISKITNHQTGARYQNCIWHDDSTGFYLLTNEGRDFLGIASYSLADESLTWLHTPDWDVELMALSKAGDSLAFVTNVDGYSRLAVRDLAGGTDSVCAEHPPGSITSITWAPDGQSLAFALDGSTHNPDIWLWSLPNGAVRQITQSDRAGLDRGDWVEPELVHYPTFDRRQIPAFYYRPKGPVPDGGFPAVIIVHGGPEAQYLPLFRGEMQFFLACGYAVLAPNVRGSTGYGAAYAALDDVDKRMDSVADLVHGRHWLGAQPEINAERIAVHGRSYGGFMVLAAVTEHPDLWAAGIEFFGIANFHTFFERTGPWRRKHRAMEYGDPVRDAELLTAISPIHKVDRITAPLFVAQGMMDPRVPPHESELIVNALKERGQPVEYITFPDEGHGFYKLSNRIDAFTAMAAFMDKYI